MNTLKSTSDDVIKKLLAVLQEKGWQSDSAEGTNFPHKSDDIANELVDTDCLPDDSMKNCFISKCKIPSLDYVVFVKGSGPHTIDYGYKEDKTPKEVIVSRKCAEAVLRGAQVSITFSTLRRLDSLLSNPTCYKEIMLCKSLFLY